MRCRGFTLIEICLAIFIALMLITMAVPSVQRLLGEENAKQSFDRFNALVLLARSHAVAERRAYVIDWDKAGVLVRPLKSGTADEANGMDRIDLGEKEEYNVDFPAALVKKPSREWIFWPSGVCEPVKISYKGNSESWAADYDPLTVQATVTNDETK